MQEKLDVVRGVTVRSLLAQPAAGAGAREDLDIVVVPGLGALGYLLPLQRELAARGACCTVLDLPGFGSARPLASPPTLAGIADMAAAWVRERVVDSRVVLVGHSTGAQAALLATLALQEGCPPAALVMAGPTFTPPQRRLPRLAVAVPAAYRRDPLRELVALPDYLRGGRDLLAMLRSGLADRPEHNVTALRTPLLLTAGRADAFAPVDWLDRLARNAVGAPWARVVRAPGSHNNPFTHPGALSTLILAAGRLKSATGASDV